MSLRNKVILAGVGESDIGKVPNMTGSHRPWAQAPPPR